MSKWNKNWTLDDWKKHNVVSVQSPKPKKKVDIDNLEKFNVEFLVERNVRTEPYGYVEKYLRFRKSKTKYKAIVKDGVLAGIVGRLYKLVPNEKIEEMIKKIAVDKKLITNIRTYEWRIYFTLVNPESNVGVIVSNSVDGSIALRVDAIVKIPLQNGYCMMVGWRKATKYLSNIYRKHSKNLSIKDLSKEIDEIYDVALKYKSFLLKLDDYKMSDYYDEISSILSRNLPIVYTDGLFFKGFRIGKGITTIKELYEKVSYRIWNRPTDIRTKINLYKKLNDSIVVLGIAIEL